MQTNELREKYLAFFETKGCIRKPSDVLVPKWDPSVLFTPAGMNQFKDHFLGRCKLEFTRATTCQKCLRTGDIDNVGRTAYHHTFFEMLGNFSFGDYFKREAIQWAWEFLTSKKWLAIDPAKLSVTVYKDDHEAAKIWFEEIGIPQNRLKYLDEDENFWPASAPSEGPDGVCGPCSEIYHDTPTGAVEIWNLVFTQFNRVGNPPNNLQPLPSKNIDTGMGLERCASVLQGVETNYHIDILRPLVETAAEVLGVKYEPGASQGDAANDHARRLRRIADHVRACTFAVHENVYPGNKEEKYVIRRLLRRAVLDGRQMGHKETFLHLLVPKVAELMKEPYPELSETISRVAKVIETEEEHFIGTVDSGLEKIERIFKTTDDRRQTTGVNPADCRQPSVVCGTDIFDMYQTYGFPPELFETMALERGYTFDWPGFKREMERHGEISGSAEKGALFKDDPLAEIKKTHKTEFVGYDQDQCEAKVIAILADGKLVDSVPEGQTVQIILDRTPFYGEKGGQVGDTGVILGHWNRGLASAFIVENTQVDGDLTVHIGHQFIPYEHCDFPKIVLKVGDNARAWVNIINRQEISRAHTATHLLHYTLRLFLGGHAEQQGSKVADDELRFDFTHHQAVDKKMLQKIERNINGWISSNDNVSSKEMDIDEARKAGAMMLFGEKYPEKVRVVKAECHYYYGDDDFDDDVCESKELCGGTHVKNTSEIGLFKIISEESVASGVRRITALTGLKAVEKMQAEASIVQQLASTLKVPVEEIPAKVESLASQVKQLQKQIKTADGRRQTAAGPDELINSAKMIGKTKVIVQNIPNGNPNDLRQLIDQLKRKAESVAVMLLTSPEEGKVLLLAGLTPDLVAQNLSAVDWAREICPILGGSGCGGRPDFVQTGGKDPGKIPEALAAAEQWVRESGIGCKK
ncbi:MAG: alanine--tRNA ligase [Planctomycetaceae bacterium]|nr:alanine--tRNA ligase [Planctomycetaceae bacterium]